ncbi:MAG TPA: NAD(+) synthase [Burkholderiales bacterium]|nr:NAD(+) synthase [Burkholderiales bacterium]
MAARAPDRLAPSVLDIDCAAESARIAARLAEIVGRVLRRRGVVVAVSGGIDSSVCAALAAKAFGRERVLALLLPEHDSSSDSTRLGRLVAEHLGLEHHIEDIGPALEAIGCYRWRDEAIRRLFPAYGPGWRSKIIIAGAQGGLTYFKLVVQSPAGEMREERMGAQECLQVVAATNFKQRLRKTLEYFHADRLNYAVIGTPNRLEYDQGFFVKNGDGSADVKPIAHLYKTQVYALARHLGLPAEVCNARPTTDTYSLPQGQDEFYFGLPWDKMDLALWGLNHGASAAVLGRAIGLPEAQAERVYADIRAKRRATTYLHLAPQLITPL